MAKRGKKKSGRKKRKWAKPRARGRRAPQRAARKKRSHRSYSKVDVARRREAARRHREMVAEISTQEMTEMLMGQRPMAPKLRAYLRGALDIDPSMIEYTTKKGHGF